MLDFIAVPFGYVMRFIYEGVGSYGLSIILFTLLTQIILLPFNWKQKKGMMDVQRIQPKMLELQKKYANNREKYAQEVQKLYDEEGVSPLSGCLPMLLTLLAAVFAFLFLMPTVLTITVLDRYGSGRFERLYVGLSAQ